MITAASLAPDSSPAFSIDGGMVAGAGGSEVHESSKVLGSWIRIGPDVAGSALLTRAIALGVGFGYQPGIYTGTSQTALRHELSSRAFVRWRFYTDSVAEYSFAIGVMANVSFPGVVRDDAPSRANYDKAIHRFAFFVSYRPSFALSTALRIGPELAVAYGPSWGRGLTGDWNTNFEFSARGGVEYRF